MGQTAKSGRKAVCYGHCMAEFTAKHLGTKLLDIGTGSNEAIYNGERVVLKAAHKGTPSIGVTINVLGNIQTIVATLEDKEESLDEFHHYTVYKVSTDWYKQHMKISQSSEMAKRTTRMVNCNLIRNEGKVIGELSCNF